MRRPVWLGILGFVVLLMLMVFAYERAQFFNERVEMAGSEARLRARVAEQRIASALQRVDLVLGDIERDLPAEAVGDVGWLSKRSAWAREIETLQILNDAGAVLADANGVVGEGPYKGDVARLVDVAGGSMVTLRGLPMPSIVMLRMLPPRDGRPAGVVRAVIGVMPLLEGTSAVTRVSDSVALMNADGLLVGRSPAGTARAAMPILVAERARLVQREVPERIFEASAHEDGMAKIYAMRQVSGFPFHVVVGVDKVDALQGWSRAVVIYGVLSIVLAAVALLFLRWATRQHLAEIEAADRADSRSRALLDAIPHLAWMKDSAGRLLAVNKAYRETAGVPDESALIGRRAADVWPPDVAALSDEIDLQVQKGGGRISYACQLPKGGPSGPLNVEVTVSPVLDAGCEFVGVAGVAIDVTEQMRLQKERVLTSRVFDTSEEGIVITDAAGRIMAVNTAFETITGYGAAEVIGRTPNVLKSGQQDDDFYREMWLSLVRDGAWSGEVVNCRKDGTLYPERLTITAVRDTAGAIENYIGVFSDISQQKTDQARITFLGMHDRLTKLPNRVKVEMMLEQALRRAQEDGRMVGVLTLDLHRFKAFNDQYGNGAGDQVLVEVGVRLVAAVRGQDIVARHGNDEFIIVMEGIQPDEVARLADQLRDIIGAPIAVNGGGAHRFSVSMGIAMFPGSGDEPLVLIRNAETAMNHAKRAGGDRLQFYNDEMDAIFKRKLMIERDLRCALAAGGGQFVVHYQPKVALSTGQIVGAEALTRWNNPAEGWISPGEFITIAEESHLIVDLWQWMIRSVVDQIVAWGDHAVPVAINVSPAQIKRREFVDEVVGIVKAAGVAPSLIELEITEGVMIRDSAMVIEILAELRRHGLRIALDDFGTGYSSLSYLMRLPLDVLKIDRAFVCDIHKDSKHAEIVRFLVSLGHALQMHVVAEGIETPDQALTLLDLGCDIGQGWHFAKPMSAFDLTSKLSEAGVEHA